MKKRTTVLCCAIASICLLFLSSLLGIAATAWAGVSRPETPSAAQKLWDETTHPEQTPNIQVISEDSGETLDGDFFGAKVIDGVTKAEPFGPWDNLDTEKTVYPADILTSVRIHASDYSMQGEIGMWYRNVGTWQGRSVDLKATLADYDFYTKDDVPSQMILWGMRDRIGFCVAGESYIDIRYDFSDSETGEPLSLPAYMTFDDVDWGQAIEITDNPGTFYVPPQSSLRCLASDNGSVVFISDGSWYDDRSTAAHNSAIEDSFMTRFEGTGQTQRFYCGYYFREGYVSTLNFLSDFSDTESMAVFCDSLDYFGYSGQPLAPSEPSTPVKEVADLDEKGQENTLSDLCEAYTYSIYHTVPNEEPTSYYESYTLTDHLPEGLELVSAAVYDETGTEVTGDFTIQTQGQTVTFTANDTNRAGFYYDTYRFDLQVKIREDADLTPYLVSRENGPEYVLPNRASVSILRDGAIEKETNETQTHIRTLYQNGLVQIHKSDEFSGVSLPDAEFTLYEWDSAAQEYRERETLVYDESAEIYLSRALCATLDNEGRFKIVETRTPDQYQGSWEEEFTLTENDQILSFDVTNTPMADHTITKTAVVIRNGGIIKEAPDTFDPPVDVLAGDIIEYQIDVVRNCTPGYRSGTFTVTDEIPSEAVWEEETLKITGEITNPSPNCAASIDSMSEEDGVITWEITDLDNGEGAHLTFQVKAPNEDALLTNAAWLHFPGKEDQQSNETAHQVQPLPETDETPENPEEQKTVTDSGKGSDTSATKKTTVTKPSSSSASPASSSPKTGDSHPVVILSVLLLGSLGFALSLFIRKIYRHKKSS